MASASDKDMQRGPCFLKKYCQSNWACAKPNDDCGYFTCIWIAFNNGGSAVSENSLILYVWCIAVAIPVHTTKAMWFLKKKSNNNCTCCSENGFPFHRHFGGWCAMLLESFSEWRIQMARKRKGDYVILELQWHCACAKPKAGSD